MDRIWPADLEFDTWNSLGGFKRRFEGLLTPSRDVESYFTRKASLSECWYVWMKRVLSCWRKYPWRRVKVLEERVQNSTQTPTKHQQGSRNPRPLQQSTSGSAAHSLRAHINNCLQGDGRKRREELVSYRLENSAFPLAETEGERRKGNSTCILM